MDVLLESIKNYVAEVHDRKLVSSLELLLESGAHLSRQNK
jgi:hypothetical protein